MHELSIAQGVMKIIQEEVQRHGVSKVTTVHVRVGQLSNLVPDALLFAFDAIKEGTVAEGATLDIETVPAIGRCRQCDIEFNVEDMMFFCPQCDGIAAEIVSGKELEVSEIEAE